MSSAQRDFSYYERTVKKMYQTFYFRRIGVSATAFLIIFGYLLFFKDYLIINGLMLAGLAGLIGFLFYRKNKFSEVYAALEKENTPELLIQPIEEEEYSYKIKGTSRRINKNTVRNLPSTEQQYTMMVGFSKTFFTRSPLEIVYYDVLALTYEESFRLKRNGYTRVPRALRRFTWRNLKSSAGNMGQFIFGNLFLMFLLYRLLRYLWSFLRMFF